MILTDDYKKLLADGLIEDKCKTCKHPISAPVSYFGDCSINIYAYCDKCKNFNNWEEK